MLEALLFWLEELLHTYDDVYVVSMSQVLAWMPVRRTWHAPSVAWTQQ